MQYPYKKSDGEWQKLLTSEEYRVLRQKGTERPGKTSEYNEFFPTSGFFACKACSQPLYSAAAKFSSGCGWPAFDKCYKGSIETHVDTSMGTRRIEIVCAKCGGHLGHVFSGERLTRSNERHCVNSVSVKYVAGNPGSLSEETVMD